MNNELNGRAESLIDEIINLTDTARSLSRSIDRGAGGREVSLAITKLQEAAMWLSAATEQD